MLSRWELIARFAIWGFIAGLLAWSLVFGLHILADVGKPTLTSLLWAMPRGAFFGAILALIMHVWWQRHSG